MNTCPICGKKIKTKGAKTCSYKCRERKKFLDKIDNIQSKFKDPLKKILENAYNSGKSLCEIAEFIGLNRTNTYGIQNIFNHFEIKRRQVGGFIKGGITDPSSEAYRKNKIRMINNNPSTHPEIRKKMSIGKSRSLLKNQSKMTLYVANFLLKNKVNFIQEKVVDKYILDFAIENIDLEIDGKGHYSKKHKDKERDDNGDTKHLNQLRRKLKKLIASGQIPRSN